MFSTPSAEKGTDLMPRVTPSDIQFVAPNSLRIVGGPKLRSGVPIVAGFMPAGVLIPDNYVIPYHDPRTKKGYQRPPQEPRINELFNDLSNGRTDLPTAVLLNLRDREARQALRGDVLDLEALLRGTALTSQFYVVDGQHRVLALKKLIEEHDADTWRQFVIPFVCMVGATEDEEMDQFYVVNSKAKSVRTDLALLLLRQRAEGDESVYEALVERGKDWQVRGQQLVEMLAERGSVWRGLIRLPAMEKGDTTMPSASMVASLKPLLGSPYFGQLSIDQQLKLLDAFWRGVREVLRQAFDDPKEFTLQKGVGVMAMHTIFVQVIELIRSKGWSVVEPESYTKVLQQPLEELQGDDAVGMTVKGVEFWRKAGPAASYSSSAGRRVLIAKIRQLLPVVEVD